MMDFIDEIMPSVLIITAALIVFGLLIVVGACVTGSC